MSYKIAIEIYVILSIVNAFLGIGQTIYQDAFPGQSLRSPFTAFPLGTTFPQLDTENLILNMTNPTNSTGTPLDWVIDGLSDFAATIAVILDFVRFFTLGFIAQLLEDGIGLPDYLLSMVTIPFTIYVAYMTFVMITNRLGN